ncbi:unnamed protein product [Linum tenue]|uniref:Phytocyanin domain-containing protein n=1 Tax=Linum tenue TaxID=586396 RepID=A0AAV0LHA7_9ROSI|nr:unnamed protein product [Linum tenue]
MASQPLVSHHQALLALMVLAVLASKTFATVFIVGGDQGWRARVDYAVWAEGKVFRVGDKLVFKYPKCFHNVVKVNEYQFQKCSAPRGVKALATGNDVVELKTVGRNFYICSVGRNCADGCQKLVIDVKPHHGTAGH